MTRSIFGRLLFSHTAVILLTIILLGVLMSYLLRSHVIETKRYEMLAKGYAVAALVTPVVNTGRLSFRLELLDDLVGADIWVVDREGKVLAGNPPPRWTRRFTDPSPKILALFAGTPQSWVRNQRGEADPSIIVAIPMQSAAMPTAVFLYTPITGINQAIEALDRILLLSLLVGTLASVTLGFFISRGLTRPIADISRAARRFAAGDFASRTTAVGNDEIGGLGKVFNSMAEDLAQIEQNRRDFLANVSHELKTPVASIQALAEALQDGIVNKPEQQQRYLSTIVAESGRIDRLIHDLLDLAQIQAGELAIAPEQVDLAKFLPDELAKYDHLLAAKGLHFKFDLPAHLAVTADPVRLAQILINLVSNAVRYSPADSVLEIAAKALPDQGAIVVTDHGPGIPWEDQTHIWDRFYRVDKSRSRSGGGTGLGLAISKGLARAMGGDITLESQPGQGAAFTLTLPQK